MWRNLDTRMGTESMVVLVQHRRLSDVDRVEAAEVHRALGVHSRLREGRPIAGTGIHPSLQSMGEIGMGDTARGLYDKFIVTRTDGTSEPGKKHDGCRYFVYTHYRHHERTGPRIKSTMSWAGPPEIEDGVAPPPLSFDRAQGQLWIEAQRQRHRPVSQASRSYMRSA